MDIELPDCAAFLTRLTAGVHPPPSLWDSRISDRGPRYVLSGSVDTAKIRIEVTRIPPRGGFFVFAPRFEGRVSEDGRRLTGRFLVPVPFLLMVAGIVLWAAAVAVPTFVAAARGAFPGTAFLDNVAPVIGGAVIFLALVAFALRQYLGNLRWITKVLNDTASGQGHRRGAC